MPTNILRSTFASAAFLTTLLCASSPAAAADANGQRYGKDMLGEYTMSAEQIAKFAEFKPSKPVPGESAIVNALLADTEQWTGPTLEVKSSSNPYNISLIVTGTALAAGDVTSLWQAGWQMNGSEERLAPLGGIAKSDVKAGERVTLSAAQGPISFKEDRSVVLLVGLSNARNFKIDEVKVQVWTGMPGTSGRSVFFIMSAALVGLVMLGLVWWSRRS